MFAPIVWFYWFVFWLVSRHESITSNQAVQVFLPLSWYISLQSVSLSLLCIEKILHANTSLLRYHLERVRWYLELVIFRCRRELRRLLNHEHVANTDLVRSYEKFLLLRGLIQYSINAFVGPIVAIMWWKYDKERWRVWLNIKKNHHSGNERGTCELRLIC